MIVNIVMGQVVARRGWHKAQRDVLDNLTSRYRPSSSMEKEALWWHAAYVPVGDRRQRVKLTCQQDTQHLVVENTVHGSRVEAFGALLSLGGLVSM